jgi:CO dehydrogenase maturation factor
MALEEGEQVDLIAMGRPEGQGCYCAVNHMLRRTLDEVGKAYSFIIVDNEAGMEHISRRTTRDVDLLVIVTDATVRGVRTAQTIAVMADEVDVRVRRKMLVVNRITADPPAELEAALSATGLEVAARIPSDDRLADLDARGQPLLHLNGTSPAAAAVDAIAERILREL